MTNASKAALLSGLVFPGLGQLVLKHYPRGIALIIAVSVGLVVMVEKATQQAYGVLEKIQSSGGAVDMTIIADEAARAAGSAESSAVNLAFYFIVACWVVGIVDAYLVGKRMDAAAKSTGGAGAR